MEVPVCKIHSKVVNDCYHCIIGKDLFQGKPFYDWLICVHGLPDKNLYQKGNWSDKQGNENMRPVRSPFLVRNKSDCFKCLYLSYKEKENFLYHLLHKNQEN